MTHVGRRFIPVSLFIRDPISDITAMREVNEILQRAAGVVRGGGRDITGSISETAKPAEFQIQPLDPAQFVSSRADVACETCKAPIGVRCRCAEIGENFAATHGRVLQERDAYLSMLVEVLASAGPSPRDHPAMSRAWARAQELLDTTNARPSEVRDESLSTTDAQPPEAAPGVALPKKKRRADGTKTTKPRRK